MAEGKKCPQGSCAEYAAIHKETLTTKAEKALMEVFALKKRTR